MTVYYSIKQILRSPLKSLLFFLLTGVSAFLLGLGASLWHISQESIRQFEDIFTTIGTVEQIKKNPQIYEYWDAEKKAYEYYKGGSYGEWIDVDVLNFDGAQYVLPPRQRPYFGAYIEELYEGVGNARMNLIVEATPLETAAADHSIPMRVEKVMGGALNEGDIIYICDHTNPEPEIFEAGKTYIMHLNMGTFIHGTGADDAVTSEYWPAGYAVGSTQYTLEGESVPDADGLEPEDWFDEVTEGFYETDRGQRWLLASQIQEYYNRMAVVQPTDGTLLLMPFYRGETVITKGRDITQEEYKEGAAVCLIPDTMAMRLGKNVGDKLRLPLYFANYRDPQGSHMGNHSLLNAEGELFSVFDDQEYEIVGIYTVEELMEDSYKIGDNEVVIPWNAVPKDSWKDNIAAFGPMQGANTSFQIPNGSIQEYLELWEKQGIEDLRITFYDKGYTQLEEGIENRKLMSWIFLASGCVMSAMILLFFSNLFITGQAERIAVERLLGRSKKQCARSILSGMVILAGAAVIIGSGASFGATQAVAEKADITESFDKEFSNALIDTAEKEEVDLEGPSVILVFVSGGGLFMAAILIFSACMGGSLKKEPLQLLGKLEE
ncbi:ABC transporter permease [Luxibacter massiliensis]|uniref:ABC transporter permease n=1 Tax=Luxibacter massiliensis TaxID=2219695 RepID=UPI000F05CFB5|nr:ABC transporter permease [Luxibacter massiliensis]